MAVTLRTPDVPLSFRVRLEEAADAALHSGDWHITLLRSRLDGQWNLLLEGQQTRCRVVISSLEKVTVGSLTEILRLLAEDTPDGKKAPVPATRDADRLDASA